MEITPPHKMFTLLNTSHTAYNAFIAYSAENAQTVAYTPRYIALWSGHYGNRAWLYGFITFGEKVDWTGYPFDCYDYYSTYVAKSCN